nr:PQQ-binding-like beta-propeller repeat protein [Candidatus Freyarchaeota archaeon]
MALCVMLLSATLLLTGLTVSQNSTLAFSPLGFPSSKEGSTIWSKQVPNAAGYCIAPSPDGSYLYVGGANWSNTGDSNSWEPALWKYDSSGEQIWNTTLNTPGPKSSPSVSGMLITGFLDIAVSPGGEAVYAVGQFLNDSSGPPAWDAILVKFSASDGTPIWNLTLSEDAHDYLYAVTISPDGNTVYISGKLSKSGGIHSFYVAAVDASSGNPLWTYELDDSSGVSYDLALSSDGNVLYAVGKYVDTQLIALDTSTHSQLWNVTLGSDRSIYSAKVSSDGSKIHALAVDYDDVCYYLTLNASNGSRLGNEKTLDLVDNPYNFDITSNESEIIATAHALGNEKPLIIAEYTVSGTLSGVITAPDWYTISYDVAASDNNSVYVVGYYENNIAGEHYMFLLEGYAEPVSSSLGLYSALLAYAAFSQPFTSVPMSSYLLAGAAVLVVALVAAYFGLKTKGQ